MEFLKKKRTSVIFLLLGIALFALFLYKFGLDALKIIQLELNYTYLTLFIAAVFISFIPATFRLKAILEAYHKDLPWFTLFKHTVAAFAVSYVTPASRVGGEPVRIYLLKKECDVEYKIGTTAVIMDKFVEFLGTLIFGTTGLVLLLYLPGIHVGLKIFFGILLGIGVAIVGGFYYRMMVGKGYFSSFFTLFRLHKIEKIKHWVHEIKDVESKAQHFFKNHKREFFKSFFFYVVMAVSLIIQIKLLLLSIGYDFNVTQIILIITVWGVLNFVPTPASLGFLEAGQSGIFYILGGGTALGLAVALLLRGAYILVVLLGFAFISQFGGKQIWKKRMDQLK